ncbi:GNAT family N-acetyltransferase [Sutcliffiella horikoshii]|uniref:GNAT family N-acetyltransferase n=1 Tax=Sutcliffiella horikoshii TaxID=79883 RepID=A0ABM6KM98_9BACI|nr:GNAT family N-acetyltransferase [Sutcliffiella horikoshii]ART77584.1 GNAT family N-acetyltransferase [Sutcliffiella horikoshii]
MEIRSYNQKDERGWVRCRTLSFLDTAYFDNVLREKETYENPSIELVAVSDDKIVGLIDIEYELEAGTICSREKDTGGMIWHIAVHPDYQRKKIGFKLLFEAEKIAKELGLVYLEAWTRDDEWVNKWYECNNFKNVQSYLHVFIEGSEELTGLLKCETGGLQPVQAFAHYVGKEKEKVKRIYKRVHECIRYDKQLN